MINTSANWRIKMDIQNIYDELVALSICVSAYQFSQDFLGMHKSYYGMLKANSKKPSTESLVNLNSSIQLLISKSVNRQQYQITMLKRIAVDIENELTRRGANRLHC